MKEKGITYLFPAKIREILEKTGFNLEELYEIRLRVNAPMIVIYGGKEYFVAKDGRLTNIQVLKSPDKTLSDEAVSVLSKSPKWEPARQRDVPVRFSYTMPIVFKLQN